MYDHVLYMADIACQIMFAYLQLYTRIRYIADPEGPLYEALVLQ